GNPLLSSHGTNPLGKTASGLWGFSPPATRCFPSHGAPILGPFDSAMRSSLRVVRPSSMEFLLPWFEAVNAVVPRAEIAVLLVKDVIEAVPSAEMKKKVLQPLLHCTQEGWWAQTNPGSEGFESGSTQAPVQNVNPQAHSHVCQGSRLVCGNRPEGRVLSCLNPSKTQAVPAVCLRGSGLSVQGSPLRPLSVAPRLYEGSGGCPCPPHSQLSRRLANSSSLVGFGFIHRDMVLNYLAQLGLWVNWEKSKLSPAQMISFLGVELDSVSMFACLSPEHAQSVLRCAAILRCGSMVPLKQVQRLLKHMASLAAVTPLGLMHMRPLQHWLHTRVPGWAWRRGTFRVNITPSCRKTLSPWTDIVFLQSEVPLEQVSRLIIVTTDASKTGWGFAWRRVEAPPQLVQPGTSRSLSLTGIHPLPVVVRSNRGSPQYRWTGTQLAEGPAQVCVSPRGLDRHLSTSTLKVHVAAISANHDLVSGRSVGKYDLIIRFLRGAQRLNPPRPHLIPSWDLTVVLQGLQQDPFEPLQSVELDTLSLKTALLTALTSVKRVGDLQALAVNSSCLEFGPADSHVVLRSQPGYVPKVPTTPFRDQVVTLQAISSQEDDPNLTLLCPVHALRIYMERTQPFRRSEQLFVCYRGQQKGKAVSKQRISHWLVDAIRTAYQARGLPCPLGVRAHSTRGVAASAALANRPR
ncbi:hypothetical protein M9458_058055, partial [Cirrhinus mrigala]